MYHDPARQGSDSSTPGAAEGDRLPTDSKPFAPVSSVVRGPSGKETTQASERYRVPTPDPGPPSAPEPSALKGAGLQFAEFKDHRYGPQ